MEGIPQVPMLFLQPLVTDQTLPLNFEKNIKEYITTNYQTNPSKFDQAFSEIQSMRNIIAQNVANVESICVMKRYFAQLLFIKARFPMEESDPLAVPFLWKDKSSEFSNSLSYNDINFELCCILFNISAAHSIIASNESRSNPDSLKIAFMNFQYAAWPLQYLKNNFNCSMYSFTCLNKTFLDIYINLFLAQAQECLMKKSMVDSRKPLNISKISIKLTEYYKKILSNINSPEFTTIKKQKMLYNLSNRKLELYTAISSYYLGLHADEEKNLSLKLSYLIHASEQITQALKNVEKDDMKKSIKFAYDVIFQTTENAKKENEFIYHERIVKIENYDKLESVTMVKPISFDVNDLSISGEDLFASLIPSDVIKTISIYSEEKLNLKKHYFEKAQLKDTELENFLLSLQLEHLNLDQPIENVSLPDELLSSSAAFSAQPDALPSLMIKINELMETSNKAEQKLLSLFERIQKFENLELAKDDGFIAIKLKIQELNSHHTKARENNAELQRAIETHSDNLKLLAKPLSQLTKEICGNFVNPMEHNEGIQLRKMLDKIDEMRRQRFQLLKKLELNLENDDITKKAILERNCHYQDLLNKEIDKHSSTINLIKQNLIAQKTILKALTEANANFADFRRQIIELNEKRALHSLTLVTAYKVFIDVAKKTDQALNFYKQLDILITALSKGILLIEETEDKKQKEIEKLVTEQKKYNESAKAVAEFSFFDSNKNVLFASGDLKKNSYNNQQDSNQIVKKNESAVTRRPRLNEYMNFYRNKIAENTNNNINTCLPSSNNVNSNLINAKHNYLVNNQLTTVTSSLNQLNVNQNLSYALNTPEQQNPNIIHKSIIPHQEFINQQNLDNLQQKRSSNIPTNFNSMQQFITCPNSEYQKNVFYANNQITQQSQNNLTQQNQLSSNLIYTPPNQIITPTAKTNELKNQSYCFPNNQSNVLTSNSQIQLTPHSNNSSYNILKKPLDFQSNYSNMLNSNQNVNFNNFYEIPQNLTNVPVNFAQSQVDKPEVFLNNNKVEPYMNLENKTQINSIVNQKIQSNLPQVIYSQDNNNFSNSNYVNTSNLISPWHQNLSLVNPYASTFKNTNSSQNVITQSFNNNLPYNLKNHNANVCATSNTLNYCNQENLSNNVSNSTINAAPFATKSSQENFFCNQSNEIISENTSCNIFFKDVNKSNTTVLPTKESDNFVESKNLINKETNKLNLNQFNNENFTIQNTLKKNNDNNVIETLYKQRPAAATVPLTQNMSEKLFNVSSSTNSNCIFGVTNVTSLTHSDNNICKESQKHNVFSTAESKNNNCVKDELIFSTEKIDCNKKNDGFENNKFKEILDPNLFNLGETDKLRLEKRKLREEFRLHGLNAKLPEPDKNDPLNSLDAHFWVSK